MLAQILGLFFSIMGIGLICNHVHVQKAVGAVVQNHAIQLLLSLLPLLLGSILIVIHNNWAWCWTVIITLVGWLIFIAGIIRTVFTEFWIQNVKRRYKKVQFDIVGFVLLALGLVLAYFGFISKM